jgi:hypothetical protein
MGDRRKEATEEYIWGETEEKVKTEEKMEEKVEERRRKWWIEQL